MRQVRLVLDGNTFAYSVIERAALHAVVVAAHFRSDGVRHVVLRSAIRPPLWLDDGSDPTLWELPAGLVEPGERAVEAAARELFEEIGARVTTATLHPLGPATLPAPAIIAEQHTFFHVEIDPQALVAPVGDGSALERAAQLFTLPLEEALALCARGELRDAKTELGLRRLKDVL